MRGVSAEAVGADLDGPDASLRWMWTMDPLPATPEMAFDPETASRLAAEIADAVLDEEIDAALARAEEALARTEERARTRRRGARERGSRRRAEDFASVRGEDRRVILREDRRVILRDGEREGEGEGRERRRAGGERAGRRIRRRRPRRPRRRRGTFRVFPGDERASVRIVRDRGDIGRGELPRIVPPRRPRISPPRHPRPRPTDPRARTRVVRGVAALARRSKVPVARVAAVDGTRRARRRGVFADARVESPA